jgi:hypothetical protein
VNRDLAPTSGFVSNDLDTIKNNYNDLFKNNPDLAHSRLLCPRKLKPNTAYHAFLIPTFETGRLAGLNFALDKVPTATTVSWEAYGNDRQAGNRFPYYYRWYFVTSQSGDFEQLVRLLKPKRPNEKVGIRDMDLQNPGAGLPGFVNPLLRLGGALRVPIDGPDPNDAWENATTKPFVDGLANFINLADDYATTPTAEPVITAPLYGCWHALTRRLMKNRDGTPVVAPNNWVHELNLDPRYRVPAGFGTQVVQKHQEGFMKAAWEQVGDIIEANRRVRWALLAREVAMRWYDTQLLPLQMGQVDFAFALTGPVHRRIKHGTTTVHFQETQSHLSTAAVSPAFRRITRPRGRLMKSLRFNNTATPDNLLSRMSKGTVRVVPPKQAPPEVLTVGKMAETFPLLTEQCWKLELPQCPNFQITTPTPDTNFKCRDGQEAPGSDSVRFKKVLKELCELIQVSNDSGTETPPLPIDLPTLTGTIITALNPTITIPKRVNQVIHWPIHIKPEQFQEAMAYPRIDKPMYEPLKDYSADLFLPNLNLIEPNSITLLQTNQKFIESYMVGLNHEFARELLWREYPTDQRGSYFRQFWSVENFYGFNNLSAEDRREKLYDIPPLHRWPKLPNLLKPGIEELGRHDHREENAGANEEELVLVIRGELLKRYPNTVIYAQKARWAETNGAFDNKKPRFIDDLAEMTEAELLALPRDLVKTPLYEAKITPDIYFLGFDLTVPAAKGSLTETPTVDNAGWFFILKERPGELRFGLDEQLNPDPVTVNDLSWKAAKPDLQDGDYLPANSFTPLSLKAPVNAPPEKVMQHNEDKEVLAASPSSARWAYLLLQAPVMMAVHAEEMLPK